MIFHQWRQNHRRIYTERLGSIGVYRTKLRCDFALIPNTYRQCTFYGSLFRTSVVYMIKLSFMAWRKGDFTRKRD